MNNKSPCRTHFPVVILGTAIGDALGLPFENKPHGHPAFKAWEGKFLPSEWHKSTPGQYSDDTQMSIALAHTLVTERGYNPEAAAKNYVSWYKGELVGPTRGIGGTLKRAMNRLIDGQTIATSGEMEPNYARVGNGTAMRSAPIGSFYSHVSEYMALAVWKVAKADAAITHDCPEAKIASFLVACGAASAIQRGFSPGVSEKLGYDWLLTLATTLRALKYITNSNESEIWKATCPRLDEAIEALDAEPTAYVARIDPGDALGTAISALYCAARAQSFQQGIETAILSGGDTDTRAAIVGGILGGYFGLHQIPGDLIHGVEDGLSLILLDSQLGAAGLLARESDT